MGYAKIGSGPKMNRVDRGNRMGRLLPPEGGLRGVGTYCGRVGLYVMRYRVMVDRLLIDEC
jgi:hypothetical protein